MKFKVSFDLIENIELQQKDFGITEENKKAFEENKDEFIKEYIEIFKKELIDEITFEEYQQVENLKVELVEE